MKNIQRIAFFILSVTLPVSYASAQITGNGNIVKKERDVQPFTAIVTSNGWDLVLTQGNTYAMIIETDENLVDKVKTEVKNGTLYIYSDARIMKSHRRMVHLTFKELNSIKASGGADVSAETTITAAGKFALNLSGGSDLKNLNLKAGALTGNFSGGSDAKISFVSVQNIELDASGGSDIYLKNISGEAFTLTLNGGSDAILEGNTGKLMITARGGSDITAHNLNVKDCILDLFGSSDAKMNVTGTLDVTLSGGSDLLCKGNPRITNRSICKSCDVSIR
jgi:hypothetical protein